MAAGCHTTAFLLDGETLIDAGTGVGELTLDELTRIERVLLSHSHLDHVLSIPLLTDAVLRRRRRDGRGPLQVWGLPATLQALRTHLFNGVIWPDFTQLPSTEAPAITLHELAIGEQREFGGRLVEVLPARHTVPACGYAVRHADARGWWVYTGDTGPNPALWPLLAQREVRDLVIEAAFSDEEAALAAVAQHHCPATLLDELSRFDQAAASIWLTHLKPGEQPAVMSGLRHSGRPMQPLLAGQRFTLD